MQDGYKALRPVPIEAPAEMLESWAGFDMFQVERELVFAVMCADGADVAALRWLACGIERRLADLSMRETAEGRA